MTKESSNLLSPTLCKQLELLRFKARKAFLGRRHGGHLSVRRGQGIEFSDYRKYEPGDNVRHIDWGVFARSDKLYVKQFREEQNITLYLILDTSTSMSGGDTDEKWTRAVGLATALAYVALMQQDEVKIIAPGLPEAGRLIGARALRSLTDHLREPPCLSQEDFLSEASQLIRRITHGGVAVLISDFLWPLPEISHLLSLLGAKNLDLNALQTLGRAELNPFPELGAFQLKDSETGEERELYVDAAMVEAYKSRFAAHTGAVQDLFNSRGVRFSRFSPDLSLSEFILHEMVASGLLQ